jgi:hypothetical protein
VASQGDEQDELDLDVQAAAPWRADERPPERWAHHGVSVASETAVPDKWREGTLVRSTQKA